VDKKPSEFDSAIADYYHRWPEEERLFLLEALRTQELIQRYAPAAPATVLDIGGGAGAYALGIEGPGWLLPDVNARLNDEHRRADVLKIARMFESEPSLLGISAHLLLVGRKPVVAADSWSG
jgi:hypothetical protein